MATVISILVGCAFGYGMALLIVSTILKNVNDIGGEDIKPKLYADAPVYDANIKAFDRPSCVLNVYSLSKELPQFADPDPLEEVHAISDSAAPSVIYKKKSQVEIGPKILQEQYDFDGDLPPVDGPLFKPLN